MVEGTSLGEGLAPGDSVGEDMPSGRVTCSSQFAWGFPDFSSKSPMSQEATGSVHTGPVSHHTHSA